MLSIGVPIAMQWWEDTRQSFEFYNGQNTFPTVSKDFQKTSHSHLRYIEWKGVKIYDFQKVTFSTLFKLYIAGLGVLIPKRYYMLG